MKTVQLPNRLVIATARYYLNRFRRKPQIESTALSLGQPLKVTMTQGVRWNKEADLDNIANALPKGWGLTASAGTFFFSGMAKKHYYVMTEGTWPRAEVRPA